MTLKKPNINLFIVGAAKSGTTSLYNYLAQHPEVFFPDVKEPNFYADAEAHNPSAYVKPKKGKFYHNKIITDAAIYFSLYDGVKNQRIIADSSPSYLWDLQSAKRIQKDFPKAKIIMLLRNPTERAFSQFLMDLKDGNQTTTNFSQALKEDAKTQPKTWGIAHLYTEIGLYHDQVKQYLDVFGNEQVKIISYQDFINDTAKQLKDICEFLQIDTAYIDTIDYHKVYNPYVVPNGKMSKLLLSYKNKFGLLKLLVPKFIKEYLNTNILFKQENKPKILPADKAYLNNFYAEDIGKLEKLIQQDLTQWKN